MAPFGITNSWLQNLSTRSSLGSCRVFLVPIVFPGQKAFQIARSNLCVTARKKGEREEDALNLASYTVYWVTRLNVTLLDI